MVAVLIAIAIRRNRGGYSPSLQSRQPQLDSFPRTVAVEVDQLSSATFRPGFKVRSLGPPNSGLFQEAKDAAVNEFAHRIKLSEGGYNFEPAEDSAKPGYIRSGGSVGVKLRIVDAHGKLFKEFTAIDTLTNEPSSLQAWLISLPSKTLYRIDMEKNSVETVWQPGANEKICVTFTYQLGDGYKAALGQLHDFESGKNP
ncbi:MAG TPA: hypothetical protein VI546_04300 [candidate division Zixibacteria bacterium]|nr:hypothetical protein [candidate division Zixibacteria bacterium]